MGDATYSNLNGQPYSYGMVNLRQIWSHLHSLLLVLADFHTFIEVLPFFDEARLLQLNKSFTPFFSCGQTLNCTAMVSSAFSVFFSCLINLPS